MDERDDAFWTIRADSMQFTFYVWNCLALSTRFTCGEMDPETMFVILNYENACGEKRVLKGEAWAADSICHEKDRAKMTKEQLYDHFTQMELEHGHLEARVVFDGSLATQGDFDLHLHMGHPIQGRSLLVKRVAVCANPLMVMDIFE
jgi:hypothetical protein